MVFYRDKSFFPSVEISGMSISQSIEAPLTLRDTLTLNGSLSTQNGNGEIRNNFILKLVYLQSKISFFPLNLRRRFFHDRL